MSRRSWWRMLLSVCVLSVMISSVALAGEYDDGNYDRLRQSAVEKAESQLVTLDYSEDMVNTTFVRLDSRLKQMIVYLRIIRVVDTDVVKAHCTYEVYQNDYGIDVYLINVKSLKSGRETGMFNSWAKIMENKEY